MSPFLSDSEVAEMCSPLRQPGAQKRYLKKLGLRFETKPNGRPLVSRVRVHGLLDGSVGTVAEPGSRAPNSDVFKAMILKKRGK